MGLQSVLVDRARVLRQVRQGQKVEGRPLYDIEASDWFKCRLDVADSSEQAEDGRWKRVARSWVTTARRDMKHQPLLIYATDLVQIVSDDLDTGEDYFWSIDGDVVPMRKRKGVIGYEFKVVQIREAPTWVQKLAFH